MKTTDDLMRAILAILPKASFGDDNDGQIIVYTNFTQDDNGQIKDMDE